MSLRERGPGDSKVTASFERQLGAKLQSAGVTIQFVSNSDPGIYFRVSPIEPSYMKAIHEGIRQGIEKRFPGYADEGAVWVIDIIESELSSSNTAFYFAGRLAVEQAYTLSGFGTGSDT